MTTASLNWLGSIAPPSKKSGATNSENYSMKIPTPPTWIIPVLLGGMLVALSFLHFAHAESTMQRDQPTTRYTDVHGSTVGTASTDSQGMTTFRDSRGSVVGHAFDNRPQPLRSGNEPISLPWPRR